MCAQKLGNWCNFPENGAEIALFSLDSQFRPLREAVRVTQGAAPSKLVYSGESVCYDEWNDYEEREFNDYTVRLKVITTDGKITEIRDIGGYESGSVTELLVATRKRLRHKAHGSDFHTFGTLP